MKALGAKNSSKRKSFFRYWLPISLVSVLLIGVSVTYFVLLSKWMGIRSSTGWIDIRGKGLECYSLACDPEQDLLYLGDENDVLKYDGKEWTSIGKGLSNFPIKCLVCDPEHDLLYAGSTGGVWKYDGTKWVSTGWQLPDCSIESLAHDPAHNQLYAGTRRMGVWKYDGNTWTDITGNMTGRTAWSLAYDPIHDILYAVATGYAVCKYDGATWNLIRKEKLSYIGEITFDPSQNVLYAPTYWGVWMLSGNNWTNTGGEIADRRTFATAFDPKHNTLYATSGNETWSYDGGTWKKIGWFTRHSLDVSVEYIACDPVHNRIYITLENGCGIYKYDF